MPSPSSESKFQLSIFKEWRLKTDPDQAVKNINANLNENLLISKNEVIQCYKKFDETQLFDLKSNQQENTHSDLFDSLLLITDEEYLRKKVHAKNSRFLLSAYDDEKLEKNYLVIYDLFRNEKRTHLISFQIINYKLTVVGNHLLCIRRVDNTELHKIHTLKIDYANFTVEKGREINNVNMGPWHAKIVPDQLNDGKFAIFNGRELISGKIEEESDHLILGDVKNFAVNNMDMDSVRLIGNKLQGFSRILDSTRFYELNLDTLEVKRERVPFNLENRELVREERLPSSHFWSNDLFYAIFQMRNQLYQLLVFDSITFKWSDVKISCQKTNILFVDENEFLTLKTDHSNGACAYYRVALRKPDTLTNLTWFCALRQSSVYGKEKYFKNVQGLQF